MEKMAENSLFKGRKAGILVHPTSFPGHYGIGDLGSYAYQFIDFLAEAGQSLWQVLPLGPTGYGDSPYQSLSSFAGQPLIISPELMEKMGLLTKEEIEPGQWEDPARVDYGAVITYKRELFQIAYQRFLNTDDTKLIKDFENFCREQNYWLEDYALFMAVKDAHGGVMWSQWDRDIAFPTAESLEKWRKVLKNVIRYYCFIQYLFFKQWFKLKKYANDKGIAIIGDIPIYTAFDSADVWAHKELFYLDEEGYPVDVAGVPPDYFSEKGQLWGNPLYDWEVHKKQNYKWWVMRIKSTLNMVDYLRIDHFRGFEAYYAIPYGAKDAVVGEWRKGPGKELFYAIQKELGGELPIFVEDLGFITPEVIELRDQFNLPGMKILQSAFDGSGDNPFLPHNYEKNSVCYTGTHDNDTILGWFKKADTKCKERVKKYMNTDAEDISWDFIRTCFASVSNMAIVPLQDVMSLDSPARMNTPGTTANNWQWRYTPEMLRPELAGRLRMISELYGRTGKKK